MLHCIIPLHYVLYYLECIFPGTTFERGTTYDEKDAWGRKVGDDCLKPLTGYLIPTVVVIWLGD